MLKHWKRVGVTNETIGNGQLAVIAIHSVSSCFAWLRVCSPRSLPCLRWVVCVMPREHIYLVATRHAADPSTWVSAFMDICTMGICTLGICVYGHLHRAVGGPKMA